MNEEEILDKIDEWHQLPTDDPRSIYEYLGMTWPEYKAWAEGHAQDKARQVGGHTEGSPTTRVALGNRLPVPTRTLSARRDPSQATPDSPPHP